MNISTIAQLAEVSTATVSRYLNNGYVSEEKRKRIQEVIERTGYRPSSSAQTLRTGRNNLIGVIVPKISSESVARMVDGITEVVNNAGYQVLLANTGNDTKSLSFSWDSRNQKYPACILTTTAQHSWRQTVLSAAAARILHILPLP